MANYNIDAIYNGGTSLPGTERIRIDSSGNVGIGTTSPAYKLDVAGSIYSSNYFSVLTAATYGPSDNSATMQVFGSTGSGGLTNTIKFVTGGSERVRIDSGGNVGVGITSLIHKIQAAGLISAGDATYNNDSTFIGAILNNDGTNPGLDLRRWNGGSAGTNNHGATYIATNSTGDTLFYNGLIAANTRATSEKMRISVGGNVGIGTSSPSSKLHVWTGTVQVSGFQSIAGGPLTFLRSDYNGSAAVQINFLNINPSNGFDSDLGIQLMNTGGSMVDVLRIKGSTGNVGIGTTSPSVKLTVSGDVTDSDVGQFRAVGSTSAAKMINVGYHTTNNYGFISALIAGTGYSALSLQPNGGNVGIGTTSPAYKLDVNGSINTSTFMYVSYQYGDAYPLQLIGSNFLKANSNYYGLLIRSGDTNFISGRLSLIGGSSKRLEVYGYEETVGYIPTVIPGGNVGIGTTSPNTKLEVYGVVRITESASGGILQMQAGSSALDFASTYYGGTYRPFTFTNGGSERMRIQSDGNVGIGTTSPLRKFHVAGGTSDATIRADTTNADANLTLTTLGQQDWGIGVDYSDSGKLKFDASTTVGGSTKMTILSDGNVGIGTTNPSQKLEIVGGEIKAGRVNSGEEGGQVSFGRASDNATGWYIDVYGSTSTPQLRFVDVSNSSVRMVVNQSGNLGIGTASPTTKLEVIGDIATFANGADTITRGVYIANAANTRAFNFQLNSGGTNLDLWSYNSAGAWVRRVSFNYDGNVGIGTTAPSSTLYVSGNVGISGNITKGGGSFLIEHPDPAKQGWKLQHSFVESPTVGDNIYRYEITINETLQGAIELPNYWKHLNENPQIWINPVNHFGIAYGEINEDISRLTVFANSVGKYNILLIGTRKDPTIKKIMADFAVERKPE